MLEKRNLEALKFIFSWHQLDSI